MLIFTKDKRHQVVAKYLKDTLRFVWVYCLIRNNFVFQMSLLESMNIKKKLSKCRILLTILKLSRYFKKKVISIIYLNISFI